MQIESRAGAIFKAFLMLAIVTTSGATSASGAPGDNDMSASAMKQIIDAARGKGDSRGLGPRSTTRELRYNDHAGSDGGSDIYEPRPAAGGNGSQHLFDLRILFASGSAELDYRSFSQLQEIMKVMADPDYRTLRFMIVGHTDLVGSADKNLVLSQRRAAAVRSFLIGKGIDQQRLEATGRGKYDPVEPTDGPSARNRRVEFRLLD